MPDLPITGGCLCGGVRFEVTQPFEQSSYCHCTRCQRRTGTAASANARPPRGAVRVVAGEDLVRGYVPPEPGAVKAFCSVCGSALWSHPREDPEARAVRLGAIDGDPGIRPRHRQFTDVAAVWEPVPDDGLPHYGGRRPDSER